jgi:hypothetical protein
MDNLVFQLAEMRVAQYKGNYLHGAMLMNVYEGLHILQYKTIQSRIKPQPLPQ